MKALDVMEQRIKDDAQRRFNKFKLDLRKAIEPFSKRADSRNIGYVETARLLSELAEVVDVMWLHECKSLNLQAKLFEQATDAVIKPAAKK